MVRFQNQIERVCELLIIAVVTLFYVWLATVLVRIILMEVAR